MPSRISTLRRRPFSPTSVASVSSAFQTYEANRQPSAPCSMNRVSARRPKRNSFQKRVPTGKRQTSGLRASMNVPFGRRIQRVLLAPSLQSGYWGLKSSVPGATVFVTQSELSPVACKVAGGTQDAVGARPAAPMVIPETAAAIVRQRRTRKPRGEVRNRARAMDVERREKNELIRARERYINDVSKDSRARPEILPEFLDDRHLPVVHEDAA